MKYRNEDRGGTSEIRADGGLIRYKAGDYPVLLLVNGETTGGGEMIAAASRTMAGPSSPARGPSAKRASSGRCRSRAYPVTNSN